MSEATLLDHSIQQLVLANRVLANENVIDGFGHVSVRHPTNPDRFLLSRSRSPEVVTRDDIMEFELDGTLVSDDPRRPYAERFIHGTIYMARPDVNSVSHHHAHAVIPFSMTDVPLRPAFHMGSSTSSIALNARSCVPSPKMVSGSPTRCLYIQIPKTLRYESQRF